MNPTGEAQGGAAPGFLQTRGRVDQARRRFHFCIYSIVIQAPLWKKRLLHFSLEKSCRKFKGVMNCLGASLVFLCFCSKF